LRELISQNFKNNQRSDQH